MLPTDNRICTTENDSVDNQFAEKLPRLNSITDKYNRFKVEKLSNVYCVVLNDTINNGESLLRVATSSVYRSDKNGDNAVLHMSVGADRYSMYISDTLADGDKQGVCPNVLVFGIISDTFEQGMAAIKHIREVEKPKLRPRQPLILFGYKTNAARGRETDSKLLKELSNLSDELQAYRCLDCSAVNRPTIRTVLAMALLAARPYISEFRSLSELRFDDDMPVVNTVSMPTISMPHGSRPANKRKIFARILPHKATVSKMCSVQ
uniref:Copine domain-containing protein n=1 Tax=Syphacia muris TaxID=451379 RepID=A0A0N5ADK3_9BILA